jgi:hypothetical protein
MMSEAPSKDYHVQKVLIDTQQKTFLEQLGIPTAVETYQAVDMERFGKEMGMDLPDGYRGESPDGRDSLYVSSEPAENGKLYLGPDWSPASSPPHHPREGEYPPSLPLYDRIRPPNETATEPGANARIETEPAYEGKFADIKYVRLSHRAGTGGLSVVQRGIWLGNQRTEETSPQNDLCAEMLSKPFGAHPRK